MSKFNASTIIKPLYKHIGVVSFFFVLVLITFYPQFNGQKLKQHDIEMWRAGAQECIDFRAEHNGQETLWTNSMFGGMPSYLVSTEYPGNLTKHFQLFISWNILGPPKIIFTALICFYICLMCFKVRWEIALLGSIAFAFSSFNLISIGAGHNAKIMALALLPLMIGGLKLVFDKKYLLGAALLAIGTSMELGAGHVQITYYGVFLIVGIVLTFIFQAIAQKNIKHLLIAGAVSLVAATLGTLPNASRLLTLKEYGEYSIRGKSELKLDQKDAKEGLTRDYVFAYSQGIRETNNLLFPNMFIASDGHKWNDSNSYPIYFGVLILILCLMSAVVLKLQEWLWLVVIAVFSLILAYGSHLPTINYWFYEHLPLYNKFRTVNMSISILQFSMVLLASLTLNRVLSEEFEFTKKMKNVALGVLGYVVVHTLVVLTIDATSAFDDQILAQGQRVLEQWVDARESGISSSILRTWFFMCLYGLIVFLIFKSKDKNKSLMLTLSLSVLLFIDLQTSNNPHFNFSMFGQPKQAVARASKADRYVMKQDGYFRVYDLTPGTNPFSDARASTFHHSLGGYHGAKLRRYQDLIDKHLSKGNMKVLQFLNTQYVIQGPETKPQRLPALGNAWFVSEVHPTASPDEELDYLANPSFDPAKIAVMDQSKFSTSKTTYQNQGTIALTNYQPNHMTYQAKTDQAGLAVFSEIFYPTGWIAKIDGKETEIKRVNYVLRALEIPEGDHTITFEFKPESYYTGEKISLYSSILVFVLLVLSIGWEIKKSLKPGSSLEV